MTENVTTPRSAAAGRMARRLLKPGGSGRAHTIPPVRGLLPIVLLLAAWVLLGTSDSFAYPEPSTWFAALQELHADGLLLRAIGRTLTTCALGLLLAIIAGVALGMAVGASQLVNRTLSPFMDFFRALPPPAVISVTLLVLGPNYGSVLFMVALGSVWPILLNTAAGMRALPKLRLEMAKSMGISPLKRFRSVLLPSLAPSVLLGIKVAVSVAFVVTLFIEILNITEGIGFLLQQRQVRFDSDGVWGLFLVVGLCGYLLNVAVALTERILLKNWAGQA